MSNEKTCYIIFATDGGGTTQFAHAYAKTYEQAFQAATQWRNEKHPGLRILKIRAEPNGFLVGSDILAENL